MSNDMAEFFGALADAPVRDEVAKMNELLAEGRKARERFDAALARTMANHGATFERLARSGDASPSQPYVETAHRVMSGLQQRLNAAEREREEAQKSASVLIAVLESLAPRLTAEECAKACAEILAGAVRYVPVDDHTDVLTKLDVAMTERDRFRDALRALVYSQPPCTHCGKVATRLCASVFDPIAKDACCLASCDDCALRGTAEAPWAEPLRRALALLGREP